MRKRELKSEAKEKVDKNRWSKVEDLKLIEGLKLYRKNWSKVAAHIGTRSIR